VPPGSTVVWPSVFVIARSASARSPKLLFVELMLPSITGMTSVMLLPGSGVTFPAVSKPSWKPTGCTVW
jgi:hypothetical protein